MINNFDVLSQLGAAIAGNEGALELVDYLLSIKKMLYLE